MRKIRKESPKKVKEQAGKLLQKISDAGVDTSYLIKGLYGYIAKLAENEPSDDGPSANVLKCLDSPDNWLLKKCPAGEKERINALISESWYDDLLLLEQYRKECWKEYQSSNLTLRHLSQLRLLHAISEAVDEINKDTNRFMLSNTQSLLSTLMKDTDTPFVFEKMGAFLKHIMIDEFQDTSTIQWNNFRKLLDNCMAQIESHNLIVGDVKQSIYRFRQSRPNIFIDKYI